MARNLTVPLIVDIGEGQQIIYHYEDNGEPDDPYKPTAYLMKVSPGISCWETCFPDLPNRILWITLLCPQLLGPACTTSQARRAQWIFDLSPARARRLMHKLNPLITARRKQFFQQQDQS